MRFGIGYDIHILVPTQEKSQIPIGSVLIPCYYKVHAHSDGDVLLHALTDACLGALALGDIGQWFPDSDPKNRNRPSRSFLTEVTTHLEGLKWRVSQIDCNVFLEEPKIFSYSDKIRRELASLLQIELACVSLKAKTMEGLGPIGERRAFAAQVLAVLEPTSR